MIIVPFSFKGVNQMAHIAHEDTVVQCVLLFGYLIIFRHKERFSYQPQFQDQQSSHPLNSCRFVWRWNWGPTIVYKQMLCSEKCFGDLESTEMRGQRRAVIPKLVWKRLRSMKLSTMSNTVLTSSYINIIDEPASISW